ncbi:MAG: twin-arginine translocase TatA/TatE family subunit [Candidatus Acidiferrales bacterium]|jgi:TatA/E family protein of Tat protein translocase
MLSIPHIIVIFVVALVIFGPEKLPELARNLGKLMAEFRRHTTDLRTTFEGHLRDLEREGEVRRIGGASASPSPSPSTLSGPQPVPSAPARSVPSLPANPPAGEANAGAIAGSTIQSDPFLPGMDPELALQDPFLASALEASRTAQPSEPDHTPEPEKVSDGSTRPA